MSSSSSRRFSDSGGSRFSGTSGCRNVPFRITDPDMYLTWLNQQMSETPEQESRRNLVEHSGTENSPNFEAAKRMRISLGSSVSSNQSQKSDLQNISDEIQSLIMCDWKQAAKSFCACRKGYDDAHPFTRQSDQFKRQLELKFRIFTTDQPAWEDWELVLPLLHSNKNKCQYRAVPVEKMLFFYNRSTRVTCKDLPTNEPIQNSDTAKFITFLKDTPLILCLEDQLIHFVWDFVSSTYSADPFEYLRQNKCTKEQEMMDHFRAHGVPKEEPYTKRTLNYLLLDPRELSITTPAENSFFAFLQAIFYIGRGQPGRPYDHLIQTISKPDKFKTEAQHKRAHIIMDKFGASFKKGRIQEIWDDGHGVIILRLFQDVTEIEGLFREHCMITARHVYGANKTYFASTINDWNKTILGPIALNNKDFGEVNKLGDVFDALECRDESEARAELGARMLAHAYGLFLNVRLEEQYECNVKIKPLPLSSMSSPMQDCPTAEDVPRISRA